jgi:hypothetical protein
MTDLFTLAGVDVPSTAPAYLDTPLGALLEIQQQKEREMEDTIKVRVFVELNGEHREETVVIYRAALVEFEDNEEPLSIMIGLLDNWGWEVVQ